MAVRAHRVKHIELQTPTFNCDEVPKLMEYLLSHGKNSLDMNGEGFIKITTEDMQHIIRENKEYGLEEMLILKLANDLNEAKKKGDMYLTYKVF